MRNEEQIQQAIETYADTVRRICMLHLKNTSDTEDIFQEVFLKYALSPILFKNENHEKAWIIRVTINACKDLLKSPWHKRTCGLEACGDLPAPQAEEGSVLSAVNELPAHYRSVIYLYYYEGYSAGEIGTILGIPRATVHTRLARGREKLRGILGGADDEQTV